MIKNSIISILVLLSFTSNIVKAQNTDSIWSLERCIDYAVKNNHLINIGIFNTDIEKIYLKTEKESIFPNVSASVNQSHSWGNESYEGDSYNTSTRFSVGAGVTLFNSFKIKNNIKKAELNYNSSETEQEEIKKSVIFSILGSYFQVLYDLEQIKILENQINVSSEQLALTEERFKLGASSKLELQQIKAQFSGEKFKLTKAQNNYQMDLLNLRQILEIPKEEKFSVSLAQTETILVNKVFPKDSIIEYLYNNDPSVKDAMISIEKAKINEKIAKADLYPNLKMSGSVGNNIFVDNTFIEGDNLAEKLNPGISLSLSVPIYQNRRYRSSVSVSEIQTKIAELNFEESKRQINKEVENLFSELSSAQKELESGDEQYNASLESYETAMEKFRLGMLTPVELLIQKNNLFSSESSVLQAKYSLILIMKKIDYYLGIPLK